MDSEELIAGSEQLSKIGMCAICRGIPIAPVMECTVPECGKYFCKSCVEGKTSLSLFDQMPGCSHIFEKKYKPMNRHIMKLTLDKLIFRHSCEL